MIRKPLTPLTLAEQHLIEQIRLAEDERILDILTNYCHNETHHPGIKTLPNRDCPNIECYTIHIMNQ